MKNEFDRLIGLYHEHLERHIALVMIEHERNESLYDRMQSLDDLNDELKRLLIYVQTHNQAGHFDV